jgi:hypothetical protein
MPESEVHSPRSKVGNQNEPTIGNTSGIVSLTLDFGLRTSDFGPWAASLSQNLTTASHKVHIALGGFVAQMKHVQTNF